MQYPHPHPPPDKDGRFTQLLSLMEDVWITHSDGEPPLWLCDADIRDGIQAMLKVDWCLEERKCLGMEADNMCCWLASELTATETAMLDPNSKYSNSLSLHSVFKTYLVVRYAARNPPWGEAHATPLFGEALVKFLCHTYNSTKLTVYVPINSSSYIILKHSISIAEVFERCII